MRSNSSMAVTQAENQAHVEIDMNNIKLQLMQTLINRAI